MKTIAGRSGKGRVIVWWLSRYGSDFNDIAGSFEADAQGFAISCFYAFDIILVGIPGAVSIQICSPIDLLIIRYAVAVAVMWGPVARGLHEESIVRWCSAAQGIAPSQIDFETRAHVSACVEQALTDPGYMTALRASL